jgi:hypothetical protein
MIESIYIFVDTTKIRALELGLGQFTMELPLFFKCFSAQIKCIRSLEKVKGKKERWNKD